MLQKTRGIVFRFVRFGETSIIVTIFTEHYGLRSYIVNGVRKQSAKSKIALYQPLTLLDLVVYHKENADILRIKEAHCCYFYKTLASDLKKSSIMMFLTEIVNKAVKEQSHPEEIFEFLYDSLTTLDQMESRYENFHLIFLLQLARHLGFGTDHVEELLNQHSLSIQEEEALQKMMMCDYQQPIDLTLEHRRSLLYIILRYYKDHLDHIGELRSILVLQEVLG